MSVINVNNHNFENEVMMSDKKVLVDFFASWCGPCRMVSPIVDAIAEERSDILVGKVNVDETPELAMQFGIISIPTIIVMKNGAVINLRSSWALNYVDAKEAVTLICGDKGGADMPKGGELRINGIKNGKQYVLTPNLEAGGVAFFDGAGDSKPADLEAACFINTILGKGELCVKAEEAACVTKILEGIYISEKTGKPYYFD